MLAQKHDFSYRLNETAVSEHNNRREISEDEFVDYDGMCWECWDDQLTEESGDTF